MRIFGQSVSGALLLMLAAGWVRSGEAKDLKDIIARAIKAEGADKRDAKYKALTMKGTGNFYGLSEEGIPFTGEWFFQGQNQSRFNMEIKVMDQALKFSQAVNGAKGWVKFNDEVNALPEDELAEAHAEMYVRGVTSLLPLSKDVAFKLAPVGEVKVDGKAAVGVRVSREGKRDVNLFFDKAGGLLVKYEYQVKDVKGGGNKDMNQETYLTEFKDFMGSKFPTKVTIKRDGKQYVAADMNDYRFVEMFEEAIFAKP